MHSLTTEQTYNRSDPYMRTIRQLGLPSWLRGGQDGIN